MGKQQTPTTKLPKPLTTAVTTAAASMVAQTAGAAVVSITGTGGAPIGTITATLGAPLGGAAWSDLGGVLTSSLVFVQYYTGGGFPYAYAFNTGGSLGFYAFNSASTAGANVTSFVSGFLQTAGSSEGPFGPGPTGYLFADGAGQNWIAGAFRVAGVNGGSPVYGWLETELTLPTATSGAVLDIISFHYDADATGPIADQAGLLKLAGGEVIVVPEPSRAALLALGAAGVLAHRRRRKELAA